MERFKACEKEIKTKAFSKEGLIAQQRLDPHEKLKLETSQWVGGQVEELGRQMEATDAEVESLGTTTKKKSSKAAAAGAGRIAELEGLNERRKWHVHRLELILRLIENGNLDPDTVNDIREDIAYFVESNGEEDFEEDPGVYDELNLDAEEEAFGMVNDDMQSSHDSQSLADTSDIVTNATPSKPAAKDKAKAKKEESAAASSEAELPSATSTYAGEKSPTSARVAPVKGRKATLENKTGPPATTKASTTSATSSASASAQGNVASPASAAPQPRQAPVVLPPIRYSAAAAAAVAPSSSQSATSGAPPATSPPAPPATSTPGVLPTHSASVKVLPAQAQPSPATRSEGPPPGLESIKTPTAATTVPPAAGPSPSTSNASLANQQAGLPSATPSSSSPDLSLDATPSRVTSPKRDSVDMSVHSLPRQGLSRDATPAPSTFPQEGGSASQVPSSLQDLAESFERAKHKGLLSVFVLFGSGLRPFFFL